MSNPVIYNGQIIPSDKASSRPVVYAGQIWPSLDIVTGTSGSGKLLGMSTAKIQGIAVANIL